MEANELDLEKAVGLIIEKDGISALTIDAVELLLGISKNKFSQYFDNDNEILDFMALRLEHEINQLMENLESMKHAPDQELTDFFKSLYDFFNLKSYFLDLMFSDLILKSDSTTKEIILRIRKAVEIHLTKIIEQGKKNGAFNNHSSTKSEVDNILHRFRLFMSDIPLTHKMIRDFQKIKEDEE